MSAFDTSTVFLKVTCRVYSNNISNIHPTICHYNKPIQLTFSSALTLAVSSFHTLLYKRFSITYKSHGHIPVSVVLQAREQITVLLLRSKWSTLPYGILKTSCEYKLKSRCSAPLTLTWSRLEIQWQFLCSQNICTLFAYFKQSNCLNKRILDNDQ